MFSQFRLKSSIICTVIILGILHCVHSQLRNTAPQTIQSCYLNITALNRGFRQPMHIDNLIAIIRKIEKKSDYLWDMRRIARTIVKRFQFDGIYHDPDKSLELRFSPHPVEAHKNQIIQSMIRTDDSFPIEWLDNDERCALHWMVSTSLNATMRDMEPERYGRYYDPTALRAKRAISNSQILPSRRPIENGAIYTRWGTVTGGRILAGIAAALQPTDMQIQYESDGSSGSNPGSSGGGGYFPDPRNPNNNPNPQNPNNNNPQLPNPGYPNNPNNQNYFGRSGRKKRQTLTFQSLQNVHAATLAGDIGQAAIMNAPYYEKISATPVPTGEWNDTLCPREYMINALPNYDQDASHAHDTWTFMTASEIRGGLDGLILGPLAIEASNAGLRLSQLLEMYYSESGYATTNGMYRSCDRVSLFSGVVNQNNLIYEQSKSFAYHYNKQLQKHPISDATINTFITLVNQAYSKFQSSLGIFSSDPVCARTTPGGGSTIDLPDEQKYVEPSGTLYTVIDYSSTWQDIVQQQRFVAKLAYELNVSPKGSRLGVVDGRTGLIQISPNWTDNAPILACKVLQQPQNIQPMNIVQVLQSLQNEIRKNKDEEERLGLTLNKNGITILIFVQGKKLDESQKSDILRILEEYNNEFGDVKVMYTSSKYQAPEFAQFTLNPDAVTENFIPIQQGNGNLSDSSGNFLKEFVQKSFGTLKYPQCNENQFVQDNELTQAYETLFFDPNTIRYFQVSSDYFYSSVDLRLRFTSNNGKVRVCVSRSTKVPRHYNDDENDRRSIECETTSGTYYEPETKRKDIEFVWTKPCRGRERAGCEHIYVSITPVSYPPPGSAGMDCQIEGCESPDQVKVTWTHYGMRCNGAYKTSVAFGTLAFLSTILSWFYMSNFV